MTWTDPLKAKKDALQEEIDKAKLCDAKEGLATAIATAESALASATTADELDEALATLQAADKDAVLRYENGLADATHAEPVVTSFVVNGTFTDNVSGWTCTGGFQNQARASNQNGAFTVPFFENWNGSAKVNKMYQTISNIPNGTYRLDIAAFVNNLADPNESQYVYANNDKVYLTTGEPTAYEVYTVVTNNQVEIGLEQTTATANWMGIDNVSLRYYGAGDVVNDAKNASHKLAWEEALAAAEAAYGNDTYANVTGSEKTALQTEINKTEPTTADGYDEAAAALTTATSAFTAAKTNYDIFAAYDTTLSYSDSDKKPAITSETTAASLITALRAYYESHALAEGVVGAVNMTSSITNANNPANNDGWTWTGNKNNPANNEPWTDADGTSSHSYFDGGNWGSNSWTTTMSQDLSLPAGTYLLTAKGRAATNTTLTLAVGEDNVALPHVSSTGNVFNRGWGDASVEFETDGRGVTILVTATSSTIHEWFSISDFRLMRLSLNEDVYAGDDEYTALNNAITAAEAKTLGFENGQYAPYNNIAALEALAAAKAIDQEAELTNFKTDVEAATTALTGAEWTANVSEVNAIYDGDFAIQDEHTSSPTTLTGWTAVEGIRQLIKNEETYPSLAYASANAAIFTWGGTTITYGEQAGYTLPLGANVYKLSCKVAGWKDGDMPSWLSATLSKTDADDVTAVKTPTVAGRINDAEGNPFTELVFYLPVTEAGNYTLKLSTNKHTVWSDFSLVKAVVEDITLDEDVAYTPEEKYADVTLARTIKADTWNTLVLPFDLTNAELKAAFGNDVAVAEYSEEADGTNSTIEFTAMGEPAITANKPVLLKTSTAGTNYEFTGRLTKTGEAKVSGTNFDFQGTYSTMKVAVDDYYITGNLLYRCQTPDKTTLKGTRAYLKNVAEAEVKAFLLDGDLVTSIDEIDAQQQNANSDAIYNLAGQRVSKAQKGIFIVNGKKVVVK